MKPIRLLPLLFLALLAACAPADDGVRRVAVTIEPLRYVAERVGGDRFAVTTMVPGGSSPETYEPTARQMAELSGSLLYVKVGHLGFERTWMERLCAAAPGMAVVDGSEGIAPLEGDPHTWTSPRNLAVIARNVCRAMAEAAPADSLYFRQRADSLCAELAQADSTLGRMLRGASPRAFLIYHPSLTYFARDYGLRQIALEQEGREPSAASLRAVADQARREGARVLFVQREFGGRNVEAVRQTTGARLVEINPLSYSWREETMNIAKALCNQ